ncbi:hypothetical protein [Sphingomonas sp. LT1P40]|uniref:hypothetical protein n=1 Tax=Alteristakelama amylovorans TaxID=3096166 RepID=UPI002FC5938B
MPASPTADLPRPLAVVAHDAGAANLILAWIDGAPGEIRAVMAGPAAELWRKRFGDRLLCDTVEAALDGAATLLSGTGWSSDIEHDARAMARARGIESIAVLDHWVNYPMRFERAGQTVLPDRLWVGDAEAARIARNALPAVPVTCNANRYQSEQVAAIAPAPTGGAVLFLLEPARSDWGRGIQGEFQALDHLTANLERLGLADRELVIRPHPSDPAGKYDAWLAANPGARLDDATDAAAAISAAEIVVGMQSAALVIALEAGRRVICALPPWAPPCQLPHDGIERLD